MKRTHKGPLRDILATNTRQGASPFAAGVESSPLGHVSGQRRILVLVEFVQPQQHWREPGDAA